MDAKTELIDEVDSSGNYIATHPRSELKKRMFFHKAALIIPIAEEGKVLLGMRAKDKHPYPGTLCCAVGGGIASGETEEQAARREMLEEIGKEYPLRMVSRYVYDQPTDKKIFTLFTTTVPVRPDELVIDPVETQYVKAYGIDEVLKMIEKSPETFAPTAIPAIREFAKAFKESEPLS